MNVHGSAGRSEFPEHHSCVVLDMPTEMSTNFPLALVLPSVSRGMMESARALPAAACVAGMRFEPPGYSPPWYWPRYNPEPRSVSGISPVLASAPGGMRHEHAAMKSNRSMALCLHQAQTL